MIQTNSIYHTPEWINAFLFLGVIAWEGLAALLFWRAAWRYRGHQSMTGPVLTAFAVGLGLWAAFMLADEVLHSYGTEAVHLRLFIGQLVTLLAIHLLPD